MSVLVFALVFLCFLRHAVLLSHGLIFFFFFFFLGGGGEGVRGQRNIVYKLWFPGSDDYSVACIKWPQQVTMCWHPCATVCSCYILMVLSCKRPWTKAGQHGGPYVILKLDYFMHVSDWMLPHPTLFSKNPLPTCFFQCLLGLYSSAEEIFQHWKFFIPNCLLVLVEGT